MEVPKENKKLQHKGSSSDIPAATNVVPYTVKQGDTLFGIALSHRMRDSQLRKLNGLFGADRLYTGQVILVFHLNNSTLDEEGDVFESDVCPSAACNNLVVFEGVQLCLKDGEVCKLIPGDVIVNSHYLSFRSILSSSPTGHSGENRKLFDFQLDLLDIQSCLIDSSHSPYTKDNTKAYLKIQWLLQHNTTHNTNTTQQNMEDLRWLCLCASEKSLRMIKEVVTNRASKMFALMPKGNKSYTAGLCLTSEDVDLDVVSLLFKNKVEKKTRHVLRKVKSANRMIFRGAKDLNVGTDLERRPKSERRDSWFASGLRDLSLWQRNRSKSLSSVDLELCVPRVDTILELPAPKPPSWQSPTSPNTIQHNTNHSSILHTTHTTQLRREIPKRLFHKSWRVVYDFEKCGISLDSFFQAVKPFQETLVVFRSTENNVFGMYVNEVWSQRRSREFYGTGECFVFKCVSPEELQLVEEDIELDTTQHNSVQVFGWTHVNNYFMNSSSQHIAIGGGGDGFALSIDADLNNGTTNNSATFANPPLNSNTNFQILALEVIAFCS